VSRVTVAGTPPVRWSGRPQPMYVRGASGLSCPARWKPAAASAAAAGPGLTRWRRARSAVTMRWSHVQRRAWLGSPESGARQIKIFFPELVYRCAPAGEWHGATAAAPGIRIQRHQQV